MGKRHTPPRSTEIAPPPETVDKIMRQVREVAPDAIPLDPVEIGRMIELGISPLTMDQVKRALQHGAFAYSAARKEFIHLDEPERS